MGVRSTGFNLPLYTTVQLAALVTLYGPAGTAEANGLQKGLVVYDSTANAVKVYNGTDFVLV